MKIRVKISKIRKLRNYISWLVTIEPYTREWRSQIRRFIPALFTKHPIMGSHFLLGAYDDTRHRYIKVLNRRCVVSFFLFIYFFHFSLALLYKMKCNSDAGYIWWLLVLFNDRVLLIAKVACLKLTIKTSVFKILIH